jgi:hypothetical protein
MKKLTVRSHEADAPIILPSGDAYDSLAILEDEGILMVTLMNVDSGILRKDGKIEIANGTYQIICENHQRLGKCLRVLTQKRKRNIADNTGKPETQRGKNSERDINPQRRIKD